MPDGNNPKIHLPIKGMVCEGCVESVKKALESVEGVERAEVSLENNEAVVTYDPVHATKNTLRKAVQSAGYEVVD
ncbi:heavy-metal-associated domain-containing protein [Methanogenium organophilum]|uniref:Heavy metal-associated domain-containing protein n=1 Tax=Methanogenium organophilum TaxID=2199 RepID=A0A9X9T7Y4_METOG|nr:heavy metal-associated domain-containing protein [Methanogenium organophilum]WAI01584.1 heavy metal-associated domain-containing protein [Methanogenium organophilum]